MRRPDLSIREFKRFEELKPCYWVDKAVTPGVQIVSQYPLLWWSVSQNSEYSNPENFLNEQQ
jgi:hypothetical protein